MSHRRSVYVKTHLTAKIDPDVDETKSNLIQGLWYSQGLEKFAYVKGIGTAPFLEPRKNLTDDLRALLWASSKPRALEDVELAE